MQKREFFVRYTGAMIRAYSSSLLMPLLSTVLLSLALPWVGYTFLVWIALVPLFLFLSDERVTRMKALAVSFFALFIHMLLVAYPLMHISGAWWAG